jgi:hypothetical protein
LVPLKGAGVRTRGERPDPGFGVVDCGGVAGDEVLQGDDGDGGGGYYDAPDGGDVGC